MAEHPIQQTFNLAVQHQTAGRLQEAERLYRQVLARQPNHADARYLLGVLAARAQQFDAALEFIQQAIAISPTNPSYFCDLGNVQRATGQLDKAIASFRQAIALRPDLPHAHTYLGNALRETAQMNEAVAAYRRAIQLKPDFAGAWTSLGATLTAMGQIDDAIAANRQALQHQPNLAIAHSNLGNALKANGQLDDAIAAYRQALQIDPNFSSAHSNLLYLLHFHPGYDARMIFEEHGRWNEQHARPLKKFHQPHTNNPDPDRPLRIGYVSPDFREHPIGRFMLSLIAAHDPARFATYCYSDVRHPDSLTSLFQQHATQWRNTLGLADDRMAQLIREDQIDILVDLTMHMAQNRLLLFARKPAPVQVTYLAYCSTTGLDTIDYRLTDPHLDPPEANDAFYSERSIHLPETYWCYPLQAGSPEVGPSPASSSRAVTFGCLNNFAKVSPEALSLWIELLRRVPNARLILHAENGNHRQRVLDRLEKNGIDPQRLKFAAKGPITDYLRLYNQIDIALDPFPYTGGTTTCDALWMGVPVVTLKGQTAVGRSGVSLLRNIGLPELIAETPDQYIQVATDLANDLPRLSNLRRTLRPTMQTSPLMNVPRFTHHIESAYREMWRSWCNDHPRA